MKPATTAAKNTIQREHAVYTKPRLTAEWDYNRFAVPTVAVAPAQTTDAEWIAAFGNLESVAQPNRPRTGIAKARLDNGVKPEGTYRDSPQATRFYPAGDTDPYKYFGSSQVTKLTKNSAGAYDFVTPVEVSVIYDQDIVANKIVVGFETSYAKPVSYTVQYTMDGKNFFQAASNPVIDSDGIIQIWNGSAGWDIVSVLDKPVVIRGVKIKVYSMSKPYAHLDLLQLGARLENDLTDFLVSYECQMEVSDRTFIAPMGKASSNTANITLSNTDGRFNNHNTNSLYYGMIDKKVKLTLDIGFDTTPQGGSGYEYIREFTMWANAWTGEGATSVTVECKDSSVFLQEIKMLPVFYENITDGAIIWQIMDYFGFANYTYTRHNDDTGTKIPFYWPQDDQTVWEAFVAVAEATQTAIYFDEHDNLQIRPRRAMYSEKDIDWNFDAIQNGTKLPDIVDMQINYDLEVNSVDVKYQPAHYSDKKGSSGQKQNESLWAPEEDTVYLHSSDLQKSLLTTSTDMWMTQATVKLWPWESDVQVEGEILHYKGKEYAYYEARTLKKKVVYSLEDQQKLDTLDAFYSFKNSYTGRVLVTDRGMYGTTKANHYIQLTSYDSMLARGNKAVNQSPWVNGGQQRMDGYLRVTNSLPTTGTADDKYSTYHILKNPVKLDMDRNKAFFGTRIRFPNKSKCFRAGITFAGDYGRGGYYLELATSETVQGENHARSAEVSLISMPSNGIHVYRVDEFNPDGSEAHGYAAKILPGEWYDLDIKWSRSSGGALSITAYLNGVVAGTWDIQSSQALYDSGGYGVYVRGNCEADFEYLYAVAEDTTNPLLDPDKTNFVDLRRGGYMSNFVNKAVVQAADRWTKKANTYLQLYPTNRFIFDEFAPVVHEVRKYNVQFKPELHPVSHSNLYVSNPLVQALYYDADAFGAEFMLVNASRSDAVVVGDDTVTLGSNDSVLKQQLFAYGVVVYQDEEKTVTKTDDASIRRRGAIKTEFQSRYIQTEAMANALGDWVKSLWAGGVDEVTLNVFGNPLIQLGDLVTINYPIKHMLPSTHKYFVVSIHNKFEKGYSSEVVIRRARI